MQRALEGVRETVHEFLDAFAALELDRFFACWDDDATVFHPFPQMAERLAGREQVRRAWISVFDYLKATLQGPPYLELRARDLDVRMVGTDAAIATFHLGLKDGLGRRTLVLEQHGSAWRVVHLHASNILASEKAANQPS